MPFSEISFDLIDHATIEAFTMWLVETRQLSVASANQRLAAIKSFLSYCAAEDPALVAIWLDVRAVRGANAPANAPDELAMPAVEALIRAPGQNANRDVRDTVMILLLFDTAARVQELLDLTIADIDTTPGRGRLTLTGKGRKTRIARSWTKPAAISTITSTCSTPSNETATPWCSSPPRQVDDTR